MGSRQSSVGRKTAKAMQSSKTAMAFNSWSSLPESLLALQAGVF
jgi:hypothetical protein